MKKITFGREPDNDIVYKDKDDIVSRHHGYLLLDGRKVYVVDKDSTNGTFVNGKPISGKTLLSSGDKVIIANKYKLEWQKYCDVEAKSGKGGGGQWKDTAVKILKYILTTVVTMTIMALINKMLR